jgi:hypothetical protein
MDHCNYWAICPKRSCQSAFHDAERDLKLVYWESAPIEYRQDAADPRDLIDLPPESPIVEYPKAEQALLAVLGPVPSLGGYSLENLRTYRGSRDARIECNGQAVGWAEQEGDGAWSVHSLDAADKNHRLRLVKDLHRVARTHLKIAQGVAMCNDLLDHLANQLKAYDVRRRRLYKQAESALIGIHPDALAEGKPVVRRGRTNQTAVAQFRAKHPGIIVLNPAIRVVCDV